MPRLKSTPSKHGDSQSIGLKLNANEEIVEVKSDPEEHVNGHDVDSATGTTIDGDISEKSDCDEIEEILPDRSEGLNKLLQQPQEESPLSGNDSEEKSSSRGLNMINPKIFTWMATKFSIDEGARTAVQDIINQYKEDFPNESLFSPLQSYQVGQLVRKIFPSIGRCKISISGKRVWVYKDLGKRTLSGSALSSGLTNSQNDLQMNSSYANQFSSPLLKTKSDATGISDFSMFNRHNMFENLPTMMNYWDNSEDSNSMSSSSITNLTSASDYDSSFSHVTSSKRRKTIINNHTIDNQVVKWIRDHYEAAEGFFVKSLELLAHFNSGNPRKPLQNLSQVGRLLKNAINQNCKHLRRYFKGTEGGKREWVYTNIRVKPESMMEFNRAIEGKEWADQNKSSRIDHLQTLNKVNPDMTDQLAAPLKTMIATVTEQQSKSLSGSGGQSSEVRETEDNTNRSFGSQNYEDKNGFSNSWDTHDFKKFKNLKIPGWKMIACTPKYVEWIRFEKDFLINRLRIVIEVRILDNWDVVIHAHGRRVLPESIGIHFVEHNLKSVSDFMVSLSNIKFCHGFPAPLYRPLEVQGHLVSGVEIWSRRTDEDVEEIRHRALNCTLMFTSDGNFCGACFHICRLNMQRLTNCESQLPSSPISSL